MLIKRYNKKGYNSIELRRGNDGSGKEIFIVQSVRRGSKGHNVYWQEQFKTDKEAIRWIGSM